MQPLSMMEEETHHTSRGILQFESAQVSIKGTAAASAEQDKDKCLGETVNIPRVEPMRNQAKMVESKRNIQATTTSEDEEMRHRDEQEILAKLYYVQRMKAQSTGITASKYFSRRISSNQ